MPVFRSVARAKAAGQFDLIAGFVYTQITYIFVESGLIGFLAETARTHAEVTAFLELSPEASERILKAAGALKLSESPQEGLWTLGETGAALSANEGAMAMIRHHALLYRDLADPLALMAQPGGHGSELSAFWTYASKGAGIAEGAAPYSELMRATQPMVWQQIIGQYPFDRHRRMLDIGGGSGAFAEAVGTATPDLELGIFDLPDVVPLAQARMAGTALAGRLSIHPGSFRTDPLPTGFDLMTLIRIVHDHDDEPAQALLRACHQALPEGGRLLIVEPMAGTRGAEGMGEAYFGMYLWTMGSGRPRTMAENIRMAEKAGFSAIKELKTPLPMIARALVATK